MSKIEENMHLARTRSRLRVAIAAVAVLGLASFALYAASAWIPGFSFAHTKDEIVSEAMPNDVVGQWGETEDGAPFLTFSSDGTVTGSDGCNGISGAWALSDGTIVLSDMISSLMACPDVELGFHGPMVTAVVSGDTITVFDENGEVSGVLFRSATQ